MQDIGVQKNLVIKSSQFWHSDKKVESCKVHYLIYIYGFFLKIINDFIIIKFQYTVKQILQKRRIINPLKHAYWNSVWNLSWAWVLYVVKVGGIWGGGKEKKPHEFE